MLAMHPPHPHPRIHCMMDTSNLPHRAEQEDCSRYWEVPAVPQQQTRTHLRVWLLGHLRLTWTRACT